MNEDVKPFAKLQEEVGTRPQLQGCGLRDEPWS